MPPGHVTMPMRWLRSHHKTVSLVDIILPFDARPLLPYGHMACVKGLTADRKSIQSRDYVDTTRYSSLWHIARCRQCFFVLVFFQLWLYSHRLSVYKQQQQQQPTFVLQYITSHSGLSLPLALVLVLVLNWTRTKWPSPWPWVLIDATFDSACAGRRLSEEKSLRNKITIIKILMWIMFPITNTLLCWSYLICKGHIVAFTKYPFDMNATFFLLLS